MKIILLRVCLRAYILYEIVFRRAAKYNGTLAFLLTFCLIGFYHLVDINRVEKLLIDRKWLNESKKTIGKDKAKKNFKADLYDKNMTRLVSMLTREPSPPANNFRKVSATSPCLFAKSSKIASHTVWNTDLSLEENVLFSLPLFYNFVRYSNKIDGFVYELPSHQYGRNICEFSLSTKRVLKVLSDHDPAKLHCLNASYINKPGWCFSFDSETFFVTTFGDIYPKTHSRHCPLKGKLYVLIQPEESFYNKKLPPDHGPRMTILDIRDKIRHNFTKMGCPYYVPPTATYPMADHVVKPLVDCEASYAEESGEVENVSTVKNVEEDRIVRWYLHDVDHILGMSDEDYMEYNNLK